MGLIRRGQRVVGLDAIRTFKLGLGEVCRSCVVELTLAS
jgi:hypothetical protein